MAETSNLQQVMRRVLVVEDDYALADLLFEVLTYENCTADLVANGLEALELLRQNDYDAIISDLMMPRVGGEALYREVVKFYPYLAEKFLFISSQATSRSGVTDFITGTGNRLLEKPFEMDQFREALKELFAR